MAKGGKKPVEKKPDYERFYAEDGSMETYKPGPLTEADREELSIMLAMLGAQDQGQGEDKGNPGKGKAKK